MLHIIFIKCKVDVMYFIFVSPSVPRFSVKKFVNQLIKNKRPKINLYIIQNCLLLLLGLTRTVNIPLICLLFWTAIIH